MDWLLNCFTCVHNQMLERIFFDEKLPIDTSVSTTAIDFNISPTTCVLNGGEDYELLFSIKQEDFEKIKGNPHMTVIGHFTAKDSGLYLVDKQGAAIPLKAQGWNHFSGEKSAE